MFGLSCDDRLPQKTLFETMVEPYRCAARKTDSQLESLKNVKRVFAEMMYGKSFVDGNFVIVIDELSTISIFF